MMGEPIPYYMKSDDVVTVVLIVCVILVTLALTMIGKPWSRKIAQLPLFNFRQNDLNVTETPGGIQPFLFIQMGLAVSLLLIDITIRMNQPLVELPLSSSALLAFYMMLAAAFLVFRWLLYRFVLWMFVPPVQIPFIMEAWTNSVCLEGVLLLPMMMVDIYYNMHSVLFVIVILVVSITPRIWLFYWQKKLFSLNLYGSLLIFLYFCALEILPIVFIAIGTRQLNRYLLFNY
jgi:hypothetical protein